MRRSVEENDRLWWTVKKRIYQRVCEEEINSCGKDKYIQISGNAFNCVAQ